jgi:hypothetical protein
MNPNIRVMYKAQKSTLNRILSIAFLIIISAINAQGRDGYVLPDYYRLLMNGKAVTMHLGIYADGVLFLQFNASEYPLHDLDAFKRGTEQAMEDTQEFQHGGETAGNYFKSRATEMTLPLFNSAIGQDKGATRHFVLVFDHHSTMGQYPIKISFYDGTLQPQHFDFPPGELEYLQKMIDIVLASKDDYITKARSMDGNPK